MPTYVVHVPHATLSAEKKCAVAEAITQNHARITGAAPYFCQVLIREDGPVPAPPATSSTSPTSTSTSTSSVGDIRFVGGKPARNHIWIRGDIRAGRTRDVRSALGLAFMRDIAAIIGWRECDIWTYICNLDASDIVEFGSVLPNPGDEEGWFNGLETGVRDELGAFAKGGMKFSI